MLNTNPEKSAPLPTGLKIWIGLFLLPILAAPQIYGASMLIFDGDTKDLWRWLLFFGVNSYSFVLIGIAVLSIRLYRRTHRLMVSMVPQFTLLSIVGLVWLALAIKPTNNSEHAQYDPRLFSHTPAEELAEATQKNSVEGIERAVKSNRVALNYQEEYYGETVLAMACHNDHVEAVGALLRCGANPNIPDYVDGKTALHEVCDRHKTSAVQVRLAKLLIAYKANVNQPQAKPNNKRKSHGVVIDMSGRLPLLMAVGNGQFDLVKLLIEHGANINGQQRYKDFYPPHDWLQGETAVVEAMFLNQYDMVEYLLQHGANPHLCCWGRKATLDTLINEHLANASLTSQARKRVLKIQEMVRQMDRKKAIRQ